MKIESIAQPVTNDQVRNEMSQYNYAGKGQKTVTQEDINNVLNSDDAFTKALLSDAVITKIKHILSEERKPSPAVYANSPSFRRPKMEAVNLFNPPVTQSAKLNNDEENVAKQKNSGNNNQTLKSEKHSGNDNQTEEIKDANQQKRSEIKSTKQIIDSDEFQDEFLTLMIRERQAERGTQSAIIEVA